MLKAGVLKAGVIEGSTETNDWSILTFSGEPSINCCNKIVPVKLESVLSRKFEPKMPTDDTF